MTLLSKRLFPASFDDFFSSDFPGVRSFQGGMTLPAVNIAEDDHQFKLELAAPGMKKEHFSIELEDDVLTVSAKAEQRSDASPTKEGERYTRREFSYMQFSRSFTLPESVDHDAIQADYTDGVLRISIPKHEELKREKSRFISIA